jgi:putative peptide zinc metalloprotease protein
VASAFHELGHATASYYGGADPGVIGVGVYLVWPAFYCDLTDSYRLTRLGRLRADLGGIYFNLLFMLLLTIVHLSTGLNALLLAIVVQHLVVLQQFIPFVRLDGYYVVSDLTGVPDLFGHLRAIIAGLVPWRDAPSKLSGLRPIVRASLTVWAMAALALLGATVVLLTGSLPQFADAARQVLLDESWIVARSIRSGEIAVGLVALMHLVVLTIQKFGLGVMGGLAAGRLLSRVVRR